MRTVILTALLALLTAFPSLAQGNPLGNPSIASDGLIWSAVRVADAFWERVGYPPRCEPVVFMYDEQERPPYVAARAYVSGCSVFVERSYFDLVRRAHAILSRSGQRAVLRLFCAVMVHERGHNLGFEHEETGIMAPHMETYQPPSECEQWAIARSSRKV